MQEKSTLMNRLLERYGEEEAKQVLEKDMLFATLETTVLAGLSCQTTADSCFLIQWDLSISCLSRTAEGVSLHSGGNQTRGFDFACD